MMKIKYMKEEPLATIKKNKQTVYEELKKNNSHLFLKRIVGGDDYLGETKIEMKKLDFNLSYEKPIDGDFENAKILFEALKHLNRTQATDERLWVGLSFTEGYDYLVHRWGLDAQSKFNYRWIFYTENRRKLFYHGLARLWWFVKLTYDESLDDPYEMTEFVYKNSEIMKNMVYRNFSNSRNVRYSIIRALMKFDEYGYKIIYPDLVNIYKKISQYGGMYILDSLGIDDLESLILDELLKFKASK